MCEVRNCTLSKIRGRLVGACPLQPEIDAGLVAAAKNDQLQKGFGLMLNACAGAGCLYALDMQDEILRKSPRAQSSKGIKRQQQSNNN